MSSIYQYQLLRAKAENVLFDNAKRGFDSRMKEAVGSWFEHNGCIAGYYIAKTFEVPYSKFTLEVQKKIAMMTGVELKNKAPQVFVDSSEEEIKRQYPRHEFALSELPITFETFYFIKYGQR